MITARPRFADRHPAAYLTLMYVLMTFVLIAAGAAATIGGFGVNAQLLIGDGALAAIALAQVARHSWWQDAGLKLPAGGSRAWLLCWLPFLAALRPLLDGVAGAAPAPGRDPGGRGRGLDRRHGSGLPDRLGQSLGGVLKNHFLRGLRWSE